MSEEETEYNPQCRKLGVDLAGKVGEPNLAVSLGIDPAELKLLLETDVVWPDEIVGALLAFAERRERQKNGSVGVGSGETMWEFMHRVKMEEAAAELDPATVGTDGVQDAAVGDGEEPSASVADGNAGPEAASEGGEGRVCGIGGR